MAGLPAKRTTRLRSGRMMLLMTQLMRPLRGAHRLGERFCHVFHACKHDELLQFERLITETEIEWMLRPLRGAHQAFFNIHSISVSVIRRSNCSNSSCLQAMS
jgi:hypothetical protein